MTETAGSPPVIHISTLGNLGNQMIQYMIAQALASRMGNGTARPVFSNIHLPIWSIEHDAIQGDFPLTETVTSNDVPLDRLARALANGTLQRVEIQTYGQRIENFLPPAAYRDVFRHRGPAFEGTGENELLCNIRQGDVLDARHPDYVLIPADFYADLATETGCRLVFMGQLEPTPYLTDLRRRFPNARFLPTRGPAADFERIRRARNIVPSISTFGWLAAWLSEADRIFQPVLGLMNPRQNPAIDLLPLDDPRYRFYAFPLHYAVPVAQFAAAHAALRGWWRFLPADRLAVLLRRTPPPRQKALYMDVFDETFYRSVHPDIAEAVAAGILPSGRYHYETVGYDEGRPGFALDRAWYFRAYPIAALETAQGDFTDADQHWLEMGRARGYLRGGPATEPQTPDGSRGSEPTPTDDETAAGSSFEKARGVHREIREHAVGAGALEA